MGLYGLGIVVAPAVGPTLGGYLVEYVNWRLIFYINVPIGVIGALAAMVVLPNFPGIRGRHFDLPGFVCVATGLFALLLALSEGQNWGWTGYRVLILLAGGINLLALFVVLELQVDEPLLDVRVFTYWPFVNSLLLISIMSIGLFAVLFYVPLFLQEGQQLTPMHTGLTLLPQALVMAVMMPTAGRIYDRIGPRWPAIIGLLLAGIGTLLLTRINIDMTRSELIEWMMIRAADYDRRDLRPASQYGQLRQCVQHRDPASQLRVGPGRTHRAGHCPTGPVHGRSLRVAAIQRGRRQPADPRDGEKRAGRTDTALAATSGRGPGRGLQQCVPCRRGVHPCRSGAGIVPALRQGAAR
jgi:MFS family permease